MIGTKDEAVKKFCEFVKESRGHVDLVYRAFRELIEPTEDEIKEFIRKILDEETQDFPYMVTCYWQPGLNSALQVWNETELVDESLPSQEYIRADKAMNFTGWKYAMGDRVRKIGDKGQWQGPIVGFYSASYTPKGYAVESERENGSVQIYPESALELVV